MADQIMADQRLESYLALIDELLHCSNGQEPEVLDNHLELVDPDFIKTVIQVATAFAHQDNQDAAKFLLHIARELSQQLGLYPEVQPS